MNTTPYAWTKEDIDLAIKTIGGVCKDSGVNLEDLRKAFPNRPTSGQDIAKITKWVSEYIKAAKATTASLTEQATSPATPAPAQAKPRFVTAEMLPEGNYALPFDGKTHFYRVSHKAGKGKWAGTTFVNVQERASDELYPIENRKREGAIKWAILDYGFEASRMLFAEKLGQCWHCTRSLTDEENPYKSHGLGPVCGPKVMG